MYPPQFDYYRAHSLDEAVALLHEHRGAKLLAGGHSLLPVMKLRLADPGALIDIGRIDELKEITTSNGRVRIGALTTHAVLAKSEAVPRALSQAAATIGDPAVRNRGTVGGNLAHSDPASDLPTVFTALDATMYIVGGHRNRHAGRHTVPAVDFFTGLFETALEDDEILTGVEVAAESAHTGSAYAKLFSPASRYAIVGVAATVTIEEGACTAASMAVGGLTPCATKTPSAEATLIGKPLSDDVIDAAAAAVVNDLGDEILGDVHASADYRRQMVQVFAGRALRQAAQRAS